MTEDRFDEFLADAAPDYNAPPAGIPRDEMWARIQEARRFQRRQVRRMPAWLIWGTSIAAVLTVGITIGRLSLSPGSQPVAVERTAEDDSAARAALPYRLATIQHMAQAGTEERELIDDALEQNNVLPRLRAAVPSGPVRVIS